MLAPVIQMSERRSPQTEDGYTRIANELLDAMLLAPGPGSAAFRNRAGLDRLTLADLLH